MANLVVGRVRQMDETERVIVLGHVRFRLPDEMPLAALRVGRMVVATYVVQDGRYQIVKCVCETEDKPWTHGNPAASDPSSGGLHRGIDRSHGGPGMMKQVIAPLVGVSLLAAVLSGCATLTGAAVGAGAGAAIGAGLDDKNRGRGAEKGALIGAGVGAAAGTLYHWAR